MPPCYRKVWTFFCLKKSNYEHYKESKKNSKDKKPLPTAKRKLL